MLALREKKKSHISTKGLPPSKAHRFKPHWKGREAERRATSKVTVRSASGHDLGRNGSAGDAQREQSEKLAGSWSELV